MGRTFGQIPTKLMKLQINWEFILDKNQRFDKNEDLVGVACNAKPNDIGILINLLDRVCGKSTNGLSKRLNKLVLQSARIPTKIHIFEMGWFFIN